MQTKTYCSKNDAFHLSQFAPIWSYSFLRGSILRDTTLAIMNTTQQRHVCGPLNLRKIFSLGRNCRKNKPALDEPLQERETALEGCPTTPQTEKHRKLKSYFTKKTYSAIQTKTPFLVRSCIGSLRITFRHHELEVIQQINWSFKAQEAQGLSQQNSPDTALS